jgi:hypothetical protein
MTQHRQPVWKASIVAPIAAPLAITVATAWDLVLVSGFAGLRDIPLAAFLFFAFGLPISYAVMLVVGLPYVLWLRSNDRLTWIPVCTGSAALGSTVWAGYWQMSLRPPPLGPTLATGAVIGLVVGVVFCWVAVGGPNNSFKRKPLRDST